MSDAIETERTILRLFDEWDAEDAHSWLSDPEVMQFIPGGTDATLDDTRRRIAGYRAHQEQYGFSKRLIIDRESGEAIGDAGLYHLPDGKRIELGFRLAKPHWGQGYAVEVGRAWLAWFDAHLNGEHCLLMFTRITRARRVCWKSSASRAYTRKPCLACRC